MFNIPKHISLEQANSDESIIKFIDQILNRAILKQASDIHFEPYQQYYRIRIRIDGLLYEASRTIPAIGLRFNTRLKIMADLDISEKRLPQDGRFTLKIENHKNYDCRLSTCPTQAGEKLVLRILNASNIEPRIDNLGLEKNQQEIFYKNIQSPQGLILVTGPTGSGKTTTLYTAINILNKISKNILTAENPIEIDLEGINQVEINHKIGLNFTTTLRAFLRQDPDVIMIGEIRDLETAEIAINAAHTGHLVLATLHTNSAAATITRLLNMGIPSFNLVSSLKLIISQRLIRKLCPNCKTINSIPQGILSQNYLNDSDQVYTSSNCKHCNQGYKGRVAIFEMLPITTEVRNIIMNNNNEIEIEKNLTLNGNEGLQKIAINKIKDGTTSIEEIKRVLA